MPPSNFEANLTLHLRVRHAIFSLFPFASSSSNDYFHMCVIIDFLANRLVFLNTVSYDYLNTANANLGGVKGSTAHV